MMQLKSKKDPTKILLLAMSNDDVEVINTLWDNSLLFGAYSRADLTDVKEGHPNYDKYKIIMQNFPDAKQVVHINIVDPFKNGEDNEKSL